MHRIKGAYPLNRVLLKKLFFLTVEHSVKIVTSCLQNSGWTVLKRFYCNYTEVTAISEIQKASNGQGQFSSKQLRQLSL